MERDLLLSMSFSMFLNFNSHAHVERDWINEYNKNCIDISTHTLTWSVTKFCKNNSSSNKISTHTLTWSVTNPVNDNIVFNGNFNSHAHVERDF